MIIFDYNQVAISNLMEQIGSSKTSVDENLVRHMILNTIRTYVKKFKANYGPEVIIACDNKNYWRREFFPHYKASRKKAREASGHDWNSIFSCLGTIRDELMEYSPYKVISVHTCEADDIIGTLVQKYSATQKIMILSSDKDFAQLQKFPNVEQFSPILKKFINEPLPAAQLKQMVIRGDKGDGIPNILSADDCIVTEGVRQTPVSSKRLAEFMEKGKEACRTDEERRNWDRNESMISFDKIPGDIKQSIIDEYIGSKPKTDRMQIMNYLIQHRCRMLLDKIEEF